MLTKRISGNMYEYAFGMFFCLFLCCASMCNSAVIQYYAQWSGAKLTGSRLKPGLRRLDENRLRNVLSYHCSSIGLATYSMYPLQTPAAMFSFVISS